jgi:uncharacterized protein (DUF58 family)
VPSAEQYLKPDVIKHIAQLDLRARFIVEGFISGLHDSPYHGFSVEFSEHRKYEPGDELSWIDWAVFARSDRFYVKKFKAETNTQCHLVMDISPSMGYVYEGMTKLDYATCIAAALGFLMIGQQDPVGLITFDEKVRSAIAPRCKRGHLSALLGHMSRVKPSGKTNISKALHEVAEMVRKRGMVIIFSDFLEDPAEVIKSLHHMAFRKHDIIVFHVLDASEAKFPFEDFATFQDIETGDTLQVDPAAVRTTYLQQLHEMIETYRRRCSEANIDYVQLDTSMPFDKALMSFLLARKARF